MRQIVQPLKEEQVIRTLQDIKTFNDYDFLDIGAGDGSSMLPFKQTLGGKGLGIDLNPAKVIKARKSGLDVVVGDALQLDKIPGKVKYTVCDNFLEHLPNQETVAQVLKKAVSVTRQFIYIRHPSFEDNDYLNSLGFKTYWSDWKGHTSMLTLTDIVELLHDSGLDLIEIYPVKLILDSRDPCILPLGAPTDQHDYKALHGPKPTTAVEFNRKIYYAYDIVGMVAGTESKRMPILLYENRLGSTKRPSIRKFYKVKSPSKVRLLASRLSAQP